ncbi:glutaminase A [Acaricomes phytoseiuli]|uniref:glutaminase A n=1 Tax=Acaricomes phytoseiuli TaxID=291968 RepID=UPI0003A345C5|nr:glutaminase A [Acaricomes phytoseiuli]
MILSPVQQYLERLHETAQQNRSGAPADYIPQLGTVSPELFGICLTSADGYTYEVGDTQHTFTIQSISKPFTYGLALMQQGFDAVDAKVDVEPSGEAFNEISLTPGTGQPRNPMINAGAITATSLVNDDGPGRFETIRAVYSAFAGRELGVDDSVFASEQGSGYRNLALAYLLRSFGIIEEDPAPIVDDYFRQCSIEVTCRDLSMMAATLANNGVNPLSGERLFSADVVERVLSVMGTSGMYDGAGSWVTHVGMPAKSGVGGGIIAVLPGQVGIAVFSPPLNEHGNSVRGVQVCEQMSQELQLHFVRAIRSGRTAVHASHSIDQRPSGVRRNDEALRVLSEHGRSAWIFELSGDLLFAGTETVIREISSLPEEVRWVVIDFLRVDEVSDVARQALTNLYRQARLADIQFVLVDPRGRLRDMVQDPELTGEGQPGPPPVVASGQEAREWCEARVLEAFGENLETVDHGRIFESSLFADLDSEEARQLRSLMQSHTYQDGEVVLEINEPFAGIFFIVEGRVVAFGKGYDGELVRLTSLGPGNTFGELALAVGKIQNTRVVASGALEVLVLEESTMEALEGENPELALKLWKALARGGYELLDRKLQETAVRLSC